MVPVLVAHQTVFCESVLYFTGSQRRFHIIVEQQARGVGLDVAAFLDRISACVDEDVFPTTYGRGGVTTNA